MADANPEPALQEALQDLNDKLDKLTVELEQTQKWQDRTWDQTQKWQDRTWDVIKWVGGISAGLAISAAIALVGIVLKQLASN